MVTTSDTWGISGQAFLFLYIGACGLAAAGLWLYARRLRKTGPLREPDVYDLALINGGRKLVVATAAAKLRQDNLLCPGAEQRTVRAQGAPPAGSDPIERAVFDAVRSAPNLSTRGIERALKADANIAERRARLVEAGLLRGRGPARLLGGPWLLGGALLAVGAARLVAGAADGRPVGFLLICLMIVAGATLALVGKHPSATVRGLVLVAGQRKARKDLKKRAIVPWEIPLAVALFGAGALWVADPTFASAWGVSREAGYGGGGGDGGGGCGGGGCGGGCGG